MNRWFALYTTINGMDFLPYSVESIIDVIKQCNGKIIFNEGCDSRAYTNSILKYAITNDGLSVDGTTEYIESLHHDNSNIIVHLKTGFSGCHNALRQKYFDYINSSGDEPFGIIVIDDDELFDENRLYNALKYIEDEALEYAYVEVIHFTYDFFHILDINFNEQKSQIRESGRHDRIYYTKSKREVIDGQYSPRLMKYRNGLNYPLSLPRGSIQNGIEWNFTNCPKYESMREILDCPVFHYGPLHSFEKKLEKHLCRKIINVFDENKQSENVVTKMVSGQVIPYEILTVDNADTNQFRHGHYKIKIYYGTHPIQITKHPRYSDELFVLEDYINKAQDYR